MRITFLKITAGMLCAGAMVSSAMADGLSSSGNGAPPSTTGGYGSNNSAPPSSLGYNSTTQQSTVNYDSSTSAPEQRHKKHNRFSVSLNIPGTDTVLTYREPKHRKHHGQQPFWVPMQAGENIPVNAVIGGSQYNPGATFYVCRVNYRGGVHPGKLYQGNCNISWGGREMVMNNYEVLVSPRPLTWVSSSNGAIPHHALPGGVENNQTLYICQADYDNGTHTGKIIGRNCNFSWGGREVMSSNYNVLVG